MIIIFVGGIGSGKSLSVVKNIIDKKQFVFTNFKLNKVKNYKQLKYEDILIKGEKAKDTKVNWPFWNKAREKYKNFSICLDEVHNIASSRNSMSNENKNIMKWLAQIRKIFSDSPNSHLYLITQRLNSIDVFFRELAHIIIKCDKYQIGDKTYIVQTYYEGLHNYEMGNRTVRRKFIGNSYFKHYESTQIITFDDVDEYI